MESNTAKKINPFYIAQQNDGWDDWSDNDDDEDDEEEQLALVVDQEYGRPPNTGYSSQSPFTNQSSPTIPSTSVRYLAAAVVTFVMLVLLLGKRNNNEETTSTSSSTSSLQQKSRQDIQHLAIIGERHSGLPWMESTLQECFPDATISTNLQRPGYFFQYEPISQHPTIVIHMTLNVYDWLEQMRLHPEYMPRHIQDRDSSTGRITLLLWREFLTTPWILDERPFRDLPFQDRAGKICQMEFEYHQVMSCMEDDTVVVVDNPIYELKQDGTAIASILELRAAKIRNHQSVSQWTTFPKLITVRYETLENKF